MTWTYNGSTLVSATTLAAETAARIAADAAEASARATAVALKQDAATAATDAELAAIASAKQWAANPDSLIVGVIPRDANGAPTSAPVVWPDGATGTYTATTISASFPGAVDAYTITKGATTYTQPLMTRDANGAVTNRPAITVA